MTNLLRKTLSCVWLVACSWACNRELPDTARAEQGPASPSGEPRRELPPPGEPRSFALLELFTSEGCASCPAADRELGEMTELSERTGRRVFTLSYHVDYWNDLGWVDPFSDARFSQRQHDYLRVFRRKSAYTPELVVNGSEEFVGSDELALRDASMRALARPATVAIALAIERDGERLTVRYAAAGGERAALVQVALVQPRAASHIAAGDNAGDQLEHRNVVRDLFVSEARLPVRGEHTFELPFGLPAADARAAVIVSDPRSRQVWAAEVGR